MCDDLYKKGCSEEKERPSSRSRKGQHAIGCDCDRSDTCPSRLLHARPSIRQDPLRAPTSSLYIYFTNRFLYIHIAIMNSDMDFDDDGPPMLVSADQPDDAENLSKHVDDMNLTRVPITIITGMDLLSVCVDLY